MRPAALLIIAAASSACAASVAPEPRSAKAETQLAKALAGKVAGPPVDCLPARRTNDMSVIDDNTILFREGRKLVYRNDPPGGCSPMSRSGYALLTRSPTSQMCRGDIVNVVDLTSKITVGSCALGDFIPYRAAAR